MYLVSYYTQKGHDWDRVSQAITDSSSVRVFLQASMEITMEEEVEKYKALLGGEK